VEYYWRTTKESNAQARQMLEKAIALDPQYAEAYARLGWTYWIEGRFQWSRDPQNLERALALGQQALALDDSLPVTHSLLGSVYAWKQQYDQAVAEGERAIALDPNNVDSYAFQANVLNFAGRPEEALRMAEQALRLKPFVADQHLTSVGAAYYLAGRPEEAIAPPKAISQPLPQQSECPPYPGCRLQRAGKGSRGAGRGDGSAAAQSKVFIRSSQRANADQRSGNVGTAYCGVAEDGAQISDE
jgi:tetratricopeptide (TPR) repeat protein